MTDSLMQPENHMAGQQHSRTAVRALEVIFCLLVLFGLVDGPRLALAHLANQPSAVIGAVAGIHMGNHGNDIWRAPLVRYIDGRNASIGGKWPNLIVLITRQAYNITRDANCKITVSTVSARSDLLPYMQAASSAGVKIILRVFPSPGNFTSPDHFLSTQTAAADNGSMCDQLNGREREYAYRSYTDIVDEVQAIHDWNAVNAIGEYGFIAANEPNNEWYSRQDLCPGGQVPSYKCINSWYAWNQMDDYFYRIYSELKPIRQVNTKLITPNMDQRQYGALLDVVSCQGFDGNLAFLNYNGQAASDTGYEEMPSTFTITNFNDGFTWDNYWNVNYEPWDACDGPFNQGMHISFYFPQAVISAMAQQKLANNPSFIIEADLSSPQQNWGNAVQDKDTANGFNAKVSINGFLSNEQRADYAAVWNLNANSGDAEQQWHQAFVQTSLICYTARPWFTNWWGFQDDPYLRCTGSAVALPLLYGGDNIGALQWSVPVPRPGSR